MNALQQTADHLSRKEAARYLAKQGYPICARTLANMASNNNAGNGPPFTRNGWKCVRYLKSDLDAWLRKRQQKIGAR